MNAPRSLYRLLGRFGTLLVAMMGWGDALGQEQVKTIDATNGAPSPRERLVSPRVAALLAVAVPKFETPVGGPATTGPTSPVSKTEVAAGPDVVRMPSVVVKERKLPQMLEVDRAELGRRAMEQYLGPEDGLDRGFLNLITSEQIPLLRIFGSTSNEARALGRYREDERLRMQSDLLEMAELSKRSGDPAAAAKIKAEVERAFRR
jgi:hypothetical protein